MALNWTGSWRRLIATTGLAGLMVGAASPAQASTVPHVTAQQARAAIPPLSALPGGGFLPDPYPDYDGGSKPTFAGCEEKRRIALHQIHVLGVDYTGHPGDTRQDEIMIWVFATPAAAASAMTKVAGQVRGCPRAWKNHDNGGTQVTEQVSLATYAPGGWRGLVAGHTTHGFIAPGFPHYAGRYAEVLISRGNVLIDVTVEEAQAPLTLAKDVATAKLLAHLTAARLS